MPKRPPDPDFAGETLYRAIDPDWIRPDGRVGSLAVTMPSTSFDRSKHRPDPSKMPALAKNPTWTRIAKLDAGDLPAPVPGPLERGGPVFHYDYRLVDDPLGEDDEGGPNEAHCLVLAAICGQPANRDIEIRAGRRKRLALELAAKLRLHPLEL